MVKVLAIVLVGFSANLLAEPTYEELVQRKMTHNQSRLEGLEARHLRNFPSQFTPDQNKALCLQMLAVELLGELLPLPERRVDIEAFERFVGSNLRLLKHLPPASFDNVERLAQGIEDLDPEANSLKLLASAVRSAVAPVGKGFLIPGSIHGLMDCPVRVSKVVEDPYDLEGMRHPDARPDVAIGGRDFMTGSVRP